MMDDDREKLPVYIERDEPPIGMAYDAKAAAMLIRKHAEEVDGDGDTGITWRSIRYVADMNAWVLDNQ